MKKYLNSFGKITFGLAGMLLLIAPLGVEAQEDTTVSVSVNGVISAFTSSGTVTLGALTPSSTGTQSIAKDVVSATTNDTDGFKLTMEDSDATVTLADGSNSFAAASGSLASPAALTNNQWGWRVDGLGTFGAGPAAVANNAAPSSLTFAAVPASGAAVEISNTTTTGTEATDVWFSARADDTQPEGTYTDTIVYTATANP